MFHSLYAVVGHRFFERAVEVLAENGLESLVYECGFSAAAHSSYYDQLAQGEVNVHILQVVALGAVYDDMGSVARSALLGHGDALGAVEVVARHGVLAEHLLWCALEYELAALASGSRSNVHDIVSVEHHVLVVFYHYHRVADVSQVFQRGDELFVVALMESDARLVEDVEHVDEL